VTLDSPRYADASPPTAPPSARVRVSSPPAPWLFGPGIDLAIGCGLAYLITVPVLLGLNRAAGIGTWSIALVGVFATFINAPHYGATLVRVYEQRADRQRYVVFTVYVTIAVIVAFLAGLRSAWIGSALITLYVSWSPWHFSGQNYGLAVMFLGRSGAAVPPGTKRWLQASFFLAFVLALITIHVEASGTVYAAGTTELSDEYRVLRLGLPMQLAIPAFGAAALAYLTCLVVATVGLRRVTTWRALLPVFALVLTEALWFVVPATLQIGGSTNAQALPFAAIWISTAHSAQYLWVSAYYARRSGRHGRTPAFLAKSLAAGSAAIVLPGLLFMPALGGTVAWSAGLASLVFAVVNLHHFLLDGAIWKLRDGRVARVLLRGGEVDEATADGGRSWMRRAVWILGAVCLMVPVVQTWELWSGLSAGSDLARLEQAARRLAWIGRDSPKAWMQVGAAAEQAGDFAAATEAYRAALALEPEQPRALSRLAFQIAVHQADDPERVAEANALAERASALARHRNPYFLDTLAVTQAAAGRFEAARVTAEQASAIARANRLPALAAEIDARVALYIAGERYRGAAPD